MNTSVVTAPDRRHLLPSETRPRMVKADLRKPEDDQWRREIGRAIERVMGLVGWNLDQLAGAVHRDSRQVARWINGQERPQMDALFAVEALRHPLVQALSELADADVEITVRLRRPAMSVSRGGGSADTWSGWYCCARDEMEFRFGLRRIPIDRYKEQYAQGHTPQQAAKAIYVALQNAT